MVRDADASSRQKCFMKFLVIKKIDEKSSIPPEMVGHFDGGLAKLGRGRQPIESYRNASKPPAQAQFRLLIYVSPNHLFSLINSN